MSKKICTLFILLISFEQLKAQNFLGISSSNYSGTHGVMLNPANAADSKYKLYINLAAGGTEIHNNYARWDAPYSLFRLSSGTVNPKYNSDISGKPIWKADYYKFTKADKAKAYVNTEIRGPSIQFSSPKLGFGIAAGVRFRLLNSFGNTSPNIATAILSGTKNPNLHNQQFNNETFQMNVGSYNEFFLSVGKVIRENNENFLKVGATIKRVTSNLSLNLTGEGVDYLIEPILPRNKYQNIIVDRTKGTFFHASQNAVPSFPWMLKEMTSLNGVGAGFAGDIGFVFEKRPNYARQRFKYKGSYIPDPNVNKYVYKFGVALQDIGFVKYADPQYVQVGTVDSNNDFIPPATFYQLNSTDEFIQDLEGLYNLDPSTYLRSYRVFMPATLVIHGDYLVREGFYVSGVLRQFLMGKRKLGPVGFSGLSIIPRFEKKNLEVSFPISLDNDYQNFNFGASLRAGPLFFGFDNVTGVMGLGKPRGLSVHAGLSLFLGHKRPKNDLMECPIPQQSKFSLKDWLKRRK